MYYAQGLIEAMLQKKPPCRRLEKSSTKITEFPHLRNSPGYRYPVTLMVTVSLLENKKYVIQLSMISIMYKFNKVKLESSIYKEIVIIKSRYTGNDGASYASCSIIVLINHQTVKVLAPSALDCDRPYHYLQEDEETQIKTDAGLSLRRILDQVEPILELSRVLCHHQYHL